MVIHLFHEKHGTKVAMSEAEALHDESHGWQRKRIAALLAPAPTPKVEVKPKRKYERKTH